MPAKGHGGSLLANHFCLPSSVATPSSSDPVVNGEDVAPCTNKGKGTKKTGDTIKVTTRGTKDERGDGEIFHPQGY